MTIDSVSARSSLRIPWPLPALGAWVLAWAAWWALSTQGATPAWAVAGGCAVGSAPVWICRGRWRQAIVAAGFPLSAWALATASAWPGWAWLLLLAPLLLAYPLRAWRDAPFFPTPGAALQGLDTLVGRPLRVLDAGCGLGHGLRALRRLWPQAELQGIECSALLALAARWRCPWARIRRGDLWQQSWTGLDLVYLFQRPESMARAWTKAKAEMAADAWLVSLEFAVPGQTPWATVHPQGQRPLWIYRPGHARSDSTATGNGR